MQNIDFFKVDLHVHTPSSNDYKGPKNDDEYLQILRKAKSNNIRVIAITDHNSISGYKNMLRIKNDLLADKKALSTITDSEQVKGQLALIEKKLSVLENILVLPGVEFEARPGIHLLVIFNDSVSPEIIEKFLLEGGYGPDNIGDPNPGKPSNWDVNSLLDETTKYDCIVIDAHTDSNKGIWNTLTGNHRAYCLRSNQLIALCYNNEQQKDKIQSTLLNKDYNRPNLAFIKASDSHNSNLVGSLFTWVKLDKISFQSLKSAFNNPLEMLTIEEPSTAKILNDLLQLHNSFGIPDLSSPHSAETFKKLICALNNSEGGYILIGITDQKNKIGLPISQNFKTIDEWIQTIEPFDLNASEDTLGVYSLQNEKIIISIYIRKGYNLISIKDDHRIYTLKGRKIVSLPATDIEVLVQDKFMADIEQRVSVQLSAVQNSCRLIKHQFDSLPIIRTFEKNSRPFSFHFLAVDAIKLDSESMQRLKSLKLNRLNGTSRGNLFWVRALGPPRLEDAYLRNSLPLYNVRGDFPKSQFRETIYILPRGAVYYAKRDYPFFSDLTSIVLKVHNSPGYSPYSMKFIASYLKSSFILWYLLNRFGTTDLLDWKKDLILTKLRLPIIKNNNPEQAELLHQINTDFDSILLLEKIFLESVIKIRDDDKLDEIIKEHNSKSDPLFYRNDCAIYRLLELPDSDIITIEDNLRANSIYIPNTT